MGAAAAAAAAVAAAVVVAAAGGRQGAGVGRACPFLVYRPTTTDIFLMAKGRMSSERPFERNR